MRIKRLVAVSCLISALCGMSVYAANPPTEPKISDLDTLPKQLETAFVTVRSDKQLTAAKAQRVVDAVMRAYDFDLARLKWKRTGLLAAPLTVAIVSVDWLDKHNAPFMGGAFDHNHFAMCERFFVNPVYDGVTAHELTHLLVIRNFGKLEARDFGWSAWMGEGLADYNGKTFRLLTQRERYPDGHIPARAIDESMRGVDVARLFSQSKANAEVNKFPARTCRLFAPLLTTPTCAQR